MSKTSKVIQDPNLIVFINQIVEAVKDGWELDESNPPSLYGYYYETHVLKDESLVEAPKPSRAEILAAARAAKAAKKPEPQSTKEASEEKPPVLPEAPTDVPTDAPSEEPEKDAESEQQSPSEPEQDKPAE